MYNRVSYFPKQIILLLVLAASLTLGRVLIFGSTHFLYLLWNIFLAALPFIVSIVMLHYHNLKRLTKIGFVTGMIVWLLLLPNAPYIVTDLIHLVRGRLELYDTFLLFSSAWAGMLLCFYSISHIETILRSKYTRVKTGAIIASIILITSFGMYLGRFLRFNSWDVFSQPLSLFENIRSIFLEPHGYADAYLFTGLSFIFIFLSYHAWRKPDLA